AAGGSATSTLAGAGPASGAAGSVPPAGRAGAPGQGDGHPVVPLLSGHGRGVELLHRLDEPRVEVGTAVDHRAGPPVDDGGDVVARDRPVDLERGGGPQD